MSTLDPLATVLARLREAEPNPAHFKTKNTGGTSITYMPVHEIHNYLDHLAPGWEWDMDFRQIGNYMVCNGTLTIRGSDGCTQRSALGDEKINHDKYGTTATNAEAQAMRRAAEKFGFCRFLWTNKGTPPPRRQARQPAPHGRQHGEPRL